MNLNAKRALIGLGLLGAAAVPGAALAGHLSVGVGINLGAPGYYAPAPVYAAPPPVYTYDAPPAVVYDPPVVYGPPAPVYGPYYYPYPRCWWDNGYRVCR